MSESMPVLEGFTTEPSIFIGTTKLSMTEAFAEDETVTIGEVKYLFCFEDSVSAREPEDTVESD